MKKILKISMIAFVLLLGLSFNLKVNAADCGSCKFGSGACTVDLRPGEGDGTLCNCSNGGRCEKGDGDACKCNKVIESTNANTQVTTGSDNTATPQVTSTNVNNNNEDNNIVPTSSTDGMLTTNNTSATSSTNSTISVVLIIIGILVLGGGVFAIVKASKSNKKVSK